MTRPTTIKRESCEVNPRLDGPVVGGWLANIEMTDIPTPPRTIHELTVPKRSL